MSYLRSALPDGPARDARAENDQWGGSRSAHLPACQGPPVQHPACQGLFPKGTSTEIYHTVHTVAPDPGSEHCYPKINMKCISRNWTMDTRRLFFYFVLPGIFEFEKSKKMRYSHRIIKQWLHAIYDTGSHPADNDAGLMCPRPMCPRPKILGCCAPWTKRSLDIVPLTDVSRPWTASSMKLAPSAAIAASVGLRHLMDQWGVWPASPTPLTRFIGLAPLQRVALSQRCKQYGDHKLI